MKTIRISPPRQELEQTEYTAEVDDLSCVGPTLGDAVSPVLNALTERGVDFSEVRLLIFPRGGDEYFTESQIARMQELFTRRNAARASGEEQSEEEQKELEQLVNAQMDGNMKRMEHWLTGVNK
jgi:hypothetical protein